LALVQSWAAIRVKRLTTSQPCRSRVLCKRGSSTRSQGQPRVRKIDAQPTNGLGIIRVTAQFSRQTQQAGQSFSQTLSRFIKAHDRLPCLPCLKVRASATARPHSYKVRPRGILDATRRLTSRRLAPLRRPPNAPAPQILVFRLASTIHIGWWRALRIPRSLGPPKEETPRPPSVARLLSSRPSSAPVPIGIQAREAIRVPQMGVAQGPAPPARPIWSCAIEQ
jgi:hypothetical protein